METLVVACCYSTAPDDFVNRMNKLGHRLGVRWRGLVIDNASQSRPLTIKPGDHHWELKTGDNSDLDFSAYFEGTNWFSEKENSSCLFTNDTLIRKHAAHLNLQTVCRSMPLLGQIRAPAISGKVDTYKAICLKNPWSALDAYVSSYCFSLNRPAISIMSALKTLAADDGVTTTRALDDPSWGEQLAVPFREFLRANVHYRDSPYSWRGMTNGITDVDLLRRKARSIYFEHRLSGEIGKAGCILPTNSGAKSKTRFFVAERLAMWANFLSHTAKESTMTTPCRSTGKHRT